MRNTLTALALAASAAVPSIASAQLSGNMGIFSEYRFRGIAQTFKQPAIQGGIDYAHASGFYIGNWNSNVSGNQYAGGPGVDVREEILVRSVAMMVEAQVEAPARVANMIKAMQDCGFGNCTNHYECQAACPKGIRVQFIAKLNREFIKAQLT